jgi:hypothetical protein
MSNISLWLQNGWQNLWKVKATWLFSFIYFVSTFRLNYEKGSPLVCLYLFVSIFSLMCIPIGQTGLFYAAYQASTDREFSLGEAFVAIRKYWIRVALFMLLAGAVFIPGLCLYLYAYLQLKQYQNLIMGIMNILLFPLAIFHGMWYFPIAGIVGCDLGIRESIKNAWGLFTANFRSLAITGIIITGIMTLANTFIGVVSILIQSNFDITSLTRLNYLAPYLSLADFALFRVMNTVSQVTYTAYGTLVFLTAFVMYSNKSHSQKRVPR